MPAPNAAGHDDVSGRELFVIDAVPSADVISALSLPSKYFVCLLAWDATFATDAEIAALMRHLLLTGCVYILCWGPDCERVHDVFDAEDISLHGDEPVAMSTWHNNESLRAALWDALFVAWPDDAYWE
jgi:hypothetical protein